MLKKVPQVKPFSVGVFRGNLDYSKLDFISSLVMKLIWLIYKRAPEGDFRNWEAIQSWAASLRPMFAETNQVAKQ
jgi:menaquinone-dependent protoporphyrinogen IX oxidase